MPPEPTWQLVPVEPQVPARKPRFAAPVVFCGPLGVGFVWTLEPLDSEWLDGILIVLTDGDTEMAKKKWLIYFDATVSFTMAVDAESEDDARKELGRQQRLTVAAFCEEYAASMNIDEDTVVIEPDYLHDTEQ